MINSRALRLSAIVLAIVAGAVLSAVWASGHAQRLAQNEEASRSDGQLALYANSLHTLIERYRTLPAVLALDPQLQQALQGRLPQERRGQDQALRWMIRQKRRKIAPKRQP